VIFDTTGRVQQAEDIFPRIVELREQASAHMPDDVVKRHALAIAYLNFGSHKRRIGPPEEAEKLLKKALQTQTRLVEKASRSAEFQLTLASLYGELSQVQKGSNRLPQAEQSLIQGVSVLDKLVKEFPITPEYRRRLGQMHYMLAELRIMLGRDADAIVDLRDAVACHLRLAEDFPGKSEFRQRAAEQCNVLAQLFANSRDKQVHNAVKAVEAAKQAVDLEPKNPMFWNTLGVAHYRAEACQAALDALQESAKIRKEVDYFDSFLLAMVHWQLGDRTKAHECYDRAAQWMEKNKLTDWLLVRQRDEAAELMGIEIKPGSASK
jgi:tetratricopeptide (TPR) repeat protein